ncbi:MAG: patatin-like phospholipase family protein [Bacteroidales bacterium]|nr:patatin-like phospholipase family protein [Candidatus Latescibacterota bacterium]
MFKKNKPKQITQETVIANEHEAIDEIKEEKTTEGYWGLALSGGGIRSASFSLGVLQALVKHKILSEIDYLSTVSGGGYIGTSLTWFLGKKGFGTDPENFPFGRPTYQKDENGTRKNESEEIDKADEKSNRILNYIRQNASYLTPGGGLGILSLFAVAMRGIFLSFFVYGALLIALIDIVSRAQLFSNKSIPLPWGIQIGSLPLALQLSIGMVCFLAVCALLYSLSGTRKYKFRVSGQKFIGIIWGLAISFAIIGSVPLVSSGLRVWIAGGLTGIGTIVGFVTVLMKSNGSKEKKRHPIKTVLPQFAAGALIYGLILGAYSIILINKTPESAQGIHWSIYIVLGIAFFVGITSKLNNTGHHRMYRDRLMELFMPDDVAIDTGTWNQARKAEKQLLHKIHTGRPYHLINTNLVLIDSSVRKYRDRGGHSFTLSRLYCGSDATKWWPTTSFAGGWKWLRRRGMTLASAMAISAAAANPNTGSCGRGPTRGRFVSALMTLLNIRLGYWIRSTESADEPNMIVPGIKALLGRGFSENAMFLELTDGGHFDNTGIYELLRRKVKLIILADGSADPSFSFGDLANVIERARVDFRVRIRFENTSRSLDGLVPETADSDSKEGSSKLAKRGYAIATITYNNGDEGHMIYIKTTLVPDLPADVYGYSAEYPSFPDQSTGDQFFNERQFEAYRELGYQLTDNAMEDTNVKTILKK